MSFPLLFGCVRYAGCVDDYLYSGCFEDEEEHEIIALYTGKYFGHSLTYETLDSLFILDPSSYLLHEDKEVDD